MLWTPVCFIFPLPLYSSPPERYSFIILTGPNPNSPQVHVNFLLRDQVLSEGLELGVQKAASVLMFAAELLHHPTGMKEFKCG